MNTLVDIARGFAEGGDSPALIYRTGIRRRVVTYIQLHEYVRRMVALLENLGVGEGDRVLLWGGNSPWWVVTYWGVVCKGAVVVPVDATSGADRAMTIHSLTSPSLVVRSESRQFSASVQNELILEELQGLLAAQPAVESLQQLPASSLAELVYTSGTTGNPKGVMLTHSNMVANIRQITAHLPAVDSSFRFLSLLPLSHMFEQTAGMLIPLSCGASVIYLKAVTPSTIMEAFGDEDVAAVIAVPRLLQVLRNGIEERLDRFGLKGTLAILSKTQEGGWTAMLSAVFRPLRRVFGKRFRFFVSGGAPLSADLFSFWRGIGIAVIEGYGLTECSPVVAANTLKKQLPGSIGYLLPGVEAVIRQDELLVRGDNVFTGYFNNAVATAEAFTEDGFFRTGDLAEMDADGSLRIKGRCREMIVTGAGINVYPDEIEELLRHQPSVRDACVIGLDRGNGDEVHAVLLLVAGGNAAAAVAAANDSLDELHRITGYTVWQEDDFPRTTTLKIRKFMVKEALQSGREHGTASVEDRLLLLISRVTGVPVADMSESSLLVSDIGLTSIARLELVTLLEEEFRLDFDEDAIGPATTIAGVRSIIRSRKGSRPSLPYRLWSDFRAVSVARRWWQSFVQWPLIQLAVSLDVEGRDNLREIEGPFLFVANHLSYLDQPCIQHALPLPFASRLATAAWAEFFFLGEEASLFQKIWKRACFEYCSLAVHVVPLPQSSGFRDSLRHMGRLVDRGASLLVFPEGERSIDGQLLPFRPGLGVMAEGLGIPLVPLAIIGIEKVLPRGERFPCRGSVLVRIGKPLLTAGRRREDIVQETRKAILALLDPYGVPGAREGMSSLK